LTRPEGFRSVTDTDLAISWGENVRRLLIAVLAAASFVIGVSDTADAMRDPFPTCIRECSPLPQLPDLPSLPPLP
jgi:hypothetical protein